MLDPIKPADPAAPAAPKPAGDPPVGPVPPSPPAAAAPVVIPEPTPAVAQGTPPAAEPPAVETPPAEPAAPTPSAVPGFTPEVRASLTGILADQRFKPLEAPTDPDEMSEEELTQFHDEYSKATDDKVAFRLMFNRNRDYVRRSLLAEQQREQVQRGNAQRAAGLLQAVHQQITTKLTDVAPDVPPDIFWAWAAPAAAQETPAHLTNPVDRWEFQFTRGIALYRERFGAPKAVPSDPNTTSRPATAVMPAGSVQPRTGSPAKSRSFVDQLGARRERILPGAQR